MHSTEWHSSFTLQLFSVIYTMGWISLFILCSQSSLIVRKHIEYGIFSIRDLLQLYGFGLLRLMNAKKKPKNIICLSRLSMLLSPLTKL